MNTEPSEPIVIDMTLADWQCEDGSTPENPMGLQVSLWHTRIDLKFQDGRSIWIEQQDGKVRIHGYLSEETGHHEPVNLDIEDTRFVVSTDALGHIGFEKIIQPEGQADE